MPTHCCKHPHYGKHFLMPLVQSLARDAVTEYVTLAEKYGLTPSELALAWCDSRWFVTSTIIGATSLDQLKVG